MDKNPYNRRMKENLKDNWWNNGQIYRLAGFDCEETVPEQIRKTQKGKQRKTGMAEANNKRVP